MKKIFTLLAAAFLSVSSICAETISLIPGQVKSSGEGENVFKNGYSITNENSKNSGSGNDDYNKTDRYLKYSSGVQYTIHIPEGKQITEIKFVGGTRKTGTTSYLKELNGKSFGKTDYVFIDGLDKRSVSPSEFSISLDPSASNTLTFTIQGTESLANIYLEETVGADIPVLETLSTPEISYNAQDGIVTISQAENADIRYTVDGSEPNEESPVYVNPFVVEDLATVKAIALGDGETTENSGVATETIYYTINIAAPVFSTLNGTVYISSETPAGVIEYSFDKATWTKYSVSPTLFETKTIYARVTRKNSPDSEIVSTLVEALPAVEAEKIIAVGLGSFTKDSRTKNELIASSLDEKGAYGINIKLSDDGKNFSSGNAIYTGSVNTTRTGIKGSNGCQHILKVPEYLQISRIVFYSYVNADDLSEIVAGWKEVNGETIDYTLTPMTCPSTGEIAKTTPDIRVFNIEDHTNEITFATAGQQIIFTMDVYVTHKTLSDPWQSGDKAAYVDGERVYILHEDPKATIIYTLDGADPDENNIYTEPAPEPAAAPARIAAATDEDHIGKTYNLAERPIYYQEGTPLNISYKAVKDGYKPSAVMTLGIGSDGQTTGIENVAVDSQNGRVEFFNLQGVRVENPAGGIFIRRQGNSVSKVIIK